MVEIDVDTALLFNRYGYRPRPGEKWAIFRGEQLVVIHGENQPRVYMPGCRGQYTELKLELI